MFIGSWNQANVICFTTQMILFEAGWGATCSFLDCWTSWCGAAHMVWLEVWWRLDRFLMEASLVGCEGGVCERAVAGHVRPMSALSSQQIALERWFKAESSGHLAMVAARLSWVATGGAVLLGNAIPDCQKLCDAVLINLMRFQFETEILSIGETDRPHVSQLDREINSMWCHLDSEINEIWCQKESESVKFDLDGIVKSMTGDCDWRWNHVTWSFTWTMKSKHLLGNEINHMLLTATKQWNQWDSEVNRVGSRFCEMAELSCLTTKTMWTARQSLCCTMEENRRMSLK